MHDRADRTKVHRRTRSPHSRLRSAIADRPAARRLLLIGFVAALVFGLCVAFSTIFVGFQVASSARTGRAALAEGRDALVIQDSSAARTAFERAQSAFESAEGRVASPVALPLRIVPIVSRHARLAHALTRSGVLAARAGAAATAAIEAGPPEGWGLRGGRIDIAAVDRAVDPMSEAARLAEQAESQVLASPERLIFGPLAGARREAADQATGAARGLRAAHAGLDALPSLLARDGSKRYVVAFANLSELRGTGGFIGYFATLEAANGRIKLLGEEGRPTDELPPLTETALTAPENYEIGYGRYGATELWQNINMGIDFPTVGNLIAQATTGTLGSVDGVIQIDPLGVSAMLELAGPITVQQWPDRITAENVSAITHHDQYVRFQGDRQTRTEFLAELIESAFSKFLSADLDLRSISALGRAVEGGHIQMFSRHAVDQEGLERLGMAGNASRARDATDVIGVVTENAAANKLDWYLRREITYEVDLTPSSGAARARVTASLRNLATTSGDPPDVGQSLLEELPIGANRLIVLLVRGGEDRLRRLDVEQESKSALVSSEDELSVYHTGVVIDAKSRANVLGEFDVPSALEGSGPDRTYRLRVLRHPVAHSDFFDVRINEPKGWTAAGPTTFLGESRGDVVLEVKLRHTLRARFLESVVLRPYRAVRDWVSGLF